MMSDFAGRIAVVTGATRGIGRAVAGAFLAEGATVLGIYGANERAAEAFREEYAAHGDRLRLFRCDVAQYEEVASFYREVEERYDAIDILVSNAGIRRDAVLAMMRPEDWHRVLEVNLSGTYHTAKHAVLLMMKKKYGRIVFITSPMARLGFAGQGNYAASKAGQIGLARSLAKETAKRRITVNCVSPGFIETDLLDGLTPEQLADYRRLVPMQRFGTPQEVAEAVLFLAGPKSAYISGAVLEVTGGL